MGRETLRWFYIYIMSAGQYEIPIPMVAEDMLLAWGANYRLLTKGEMLFEEGAPGHYYHQLVRGRVKWVNIDEDGREFIQAVVLPGESVGELPLFDGGPYAASAVAIDDGVSLLRLGKATFLQMLREEPALHFNFTRMITARLRGKFIFLKELSCPHPERRIMAVLRYHRERGAGDPIHRILIPLTRQQIANMTGLRVETVIRTVRSLQQAGRLLIVDGKVYF